MKTQMGRKLKRNLKRAGGGGAKCGNVFLSLSLFVYCEEENVVQEGLNWYT